MAGQFNMRSPGVKRLMREAEELREPTVDYYAQPLDDNLFEWHFTVRGPSDSDFQDGVYHGRIILPTEYPMKPPSILLLTPNGRFEINKKICLSISGHHPESWQPSWSIRTALLAIIGFMPTEGLGAIGSLDYSPSERHDLAAKSQIWSCPSCGKIKELLKEKTEQSSREQRNDDKELAELVSKICFKQNNQASSSAATVEPEGPNVTGETVAAVGGTAAATAVPADDSRSGLRQRVVADSDDHSTSSTSSSGSQGTQESTAAQSEVVANANLDSASPFVSTYLIIFLSAAIAFLLFRRFFMVE